MLYMSYAVYASPTAIQNWTCAYCGAVGRAVGVDGLVTNREYELQAFVARVADVGIVMSVALEEQSKAWSPMEVTDAGIVMAVAL